jgi:hypothetical protein
MEPVEASIEMEFVDLAEATQVTNDKGQTIEAWSLARLLERRGGKETVLATTAFPKKLTEEEKTALVKMYADSFKDRKLIAKRAMQKAGYLAQEEERRQKRKLARQARKKARR